MDTLLRPGFVRSTVAELPLLASPSVPLPRWLFVGAVWGLLVSLGVAATFLVASRLFPDDDPGRARGSYRSTEVRRRDEIRRYLEAIDERFVEDATVAGRAVAFHLPERDVAVTFDGRTFLELERSPTHGILMEHEMPGIALGHRLPFETPEAFFEERRRSGADYDQSRRTSGRVSNAGGDESAFSVLGLSVGADEDAVQRAYREQIKEVHPDRGGTEAEFREVREAYDTARQYAQ